MRFNKEWLHELFGGEDEFRSFLDSVGPAIRSVCQPENEKILNPERQKVLLELAEVFRIAGVDAETDVTNGGFSNSGFAKATAEQFSFSEDELRRFSELIRGAYRVKMEPKSDGKVYMSATVKDAILDV